MTAPMAGPDPQEVIEAPNYTPPVSDDPGDPIIDPAHPDFVEPYADATRPAGA